MRFKRFRHPLMEVFCYFSGVVSFALNIFDCFCAHFYVVLNLFSQCLDYLIRRAGAVIVIRDPLEVVA